MPMNRDLQVDINNEREWRRYQLKKLDSIDKRLSELEKAASILQVKIGLISAFFGVIGAACIEVFSK